VDYCSVTKALVESPSMHSVAIPWSRCRQ